MRGVFALLRLVMTCLAVVSSASATFPSTSETFLSVLARKMGIIDFYANLFRGMKATFFDPFNRVLSPGSRLPPPPQFEESSSVSTTMEGDSSQFYPNFNLDLFQHPVPHDSINSNDAEFKNPLTTTTPRTTLSGIGLFVIKAPNLATPSSFIQSSGLEKEKKRRKEKTSWIGSWVPVRNPNAEIVVTAQYNASRFPPPSGLLGLAYPIRDFPNAGRQVQTTTPKPALSFYLKPPPTGAADFKPSYEDVTLFYPVFTTPKTATSSTTRRNLFFFTTVPTRDEEVKFPNNPIETTTDHKIYFLPQTTTTPKAVVKSLPASKDLKVKSLSQGKPKPQEVKSLKPWQKTKKVNNRGKPKKLVIVKSLPPSGVTTTETPPWSDTTTLAERFVSSLAPKRYHKVNKIKVVHPSYHVRAKSPRPQYSFPKRPPLQALAFSNPFVTIQPRRQKVETDGAENSRKDKPSSSGGYSVHQKPPVVQRFPVFDDRRSDQDRSNSDTVGTVVFPEHVTRKKITKEIPIKLMDTDGDGAETIRIYRAGVPYLRFTKTHKRNREKTGTEETPDFLHEISVFSTENPLPFLKFGYSFGGGRDGRDLKTGEGEEVTERPQPVYLPKTTTPVPDLESLLPSSAPLQPPPPRVLSSFPAVPDPKPPLREEARREEVNKFVFNFGPDRTVFLDYPFQSVGAKRSPRNKTK